MSVVLLTPDLGRDLAESCRFSPTSLTGPCANAQYQKCDRLVASRRLPFQLQFLLNIRTKMNKLLGELSELVDVPIVDDY